MLFKTRNFIFLCFVSTLILFFNQILEATTLKYNQQSKLVETLGSLVFYLNDLKGELENNSLKEQNDSFKLTFSQEEVETLWIRSHEDFNALIQDPSYHQPALLFQEALQFYEIGKRDLDLSLIAEANQEIKKALENLSKAWEQTSDKMLNTTLSVQRMTETVLRRQQSLLDGINSIPRKIKARMAPYIIPSSHPMKSQLDAIFKSARVTLNDATLREANFRTIAIRPRTHIRVLKHPTLPGYLVKANLDNDHHLKKGIPSWEWLVKRVEGADLVREIIQSKKTNFFTVASKWIYPLPDSPAPPKSPLYTRHYSVLLVTDMELAPDRENIYAWRNKITEKHLEQLYSIISYAKGSSYRPDNISYTIHNQFAFIDTEYPGRRPDYKSIRPYLNTKMRSYWDKLVRNGGRL